MHGEDFEIRREAKFVESRLSMLSLPLRAVLCQKSACCRAVVPPVHAHQMPSVLEVHTDV